MAMSQAGGLSAKLLPEVIDCEVSCFMGLAIPAPANPLLKNAKARGISASRS